MNSSIKIKLVSGLRDIYPRKDSTSRLNNSIIIDITNNRIRSLREILKSYLSIASLI